VNVPTTRTHAMARKIRVVVVEDSLVQRAHLVSVLEADGDIVVVGEAITAIEAIDAVASQHPDVVTLDLQIPGGGGQHALEQIMALTPTPVLVLSGTVHNSTSAPAIEALVAGALLAVPKPMRWTPTLEHDLRRQVRMLRSVPVIRHINPRSRPAPPTINDPRADRSPTASASAPAPASASTSASASASTSTSTMVVAIAASTGGPPALAVVLAGLSGLNVPVLIVQHLHADFVGGLINWMRRVSPLPVVLAVHGQELRNGFVYIAPGGHHLLVTASRRIGLADHPVTIHRPSANELFESVARQTGSNGIGVVLTGMGDDGATGLAEMHRCGAVTMAQDEQSCAVYGMPRAAVRLGAVDQLLPLSAIAGAIMRAARGQRARR
jgi:two-component system, chemotaxis family, protein-glutamate methylesterase/glutaminase